MNIVKIWFWLVCAVLMSTMFVFLVKIDLTSMIQVIAFLVVLIAIGLTFYIYIERPDLSEIRRMRKIYSEYIHSKDKLIGDLRETNDLMFKTAMKNSESNLDISDLRRKLEEK